MLGQRRLELLPVGQGSYHFDLRHTGQAIEVSVDDALVVIQDGDPDLL